MAPLIPRSFTYPMLDQPSIPRQPPSHSSPSQYVTARCHSLSQLLFGCGDRLRKAVVPCRVCWPSAPFHEQSLAHQSLQIPLERPPVNLRPQRFILLDGHPPVLQQVAERHCPVDQLFAWTIVQRTIAQSSGPAGRHVFKEPATFLSLSMGTRPHHGHVLRTCPQIVNMWTRYIHVSTTSLPSRTQPTPNFSKGYFPVSRFSGWF